MRYRAMDGFQTFNIYYRDSFSLLTSTYMFTKYYRADLKVPKEFVSHIEVKYQNML